MKTKKPEHCACIERSLVLSTAHITKQDSMLLENNVTKEDAYGFTVVANSNYITEWTKLGISAACVDLLRLAIRLKVDYLVLECDGFVRDDLPRFDW